MYAPAVLNSSVLWDGCQHWDRGHSHMQMVHENSCLNIRNTFFYSEDDQTQKVVAQRGCGISILGGIQNLTGHYPRPLAPADCAWPGGLEKTNSMGAFPSQQAFDSVTLRAWLLWSLAFIASLVSPSVSLVYLHFLDNTGSKEVAASEKEGEMNQPDL